MFYLVSITRDSEGTEATDPHTLAESMSPYSSPTTSYRYRIDGDTEVFSNVTIIKYFIRIPYSNVNLPSDLFNYFFLVRTLSTGSQKRN